MGWKASGSRATKGPEQVGQRMENPEGPAAARGIRNRFPQALQATSRSSVVVRTSPPQRKICTGSRGRT